MEVKEYTEKEAINLALELELTDGEEINSKFYRKNGYINSNASLQAFIEKLRCGFETVELKLNKNSNKGKGDRPFSGKKRRYLIGKQRERAIERVDRRMNNGQKQVHPYEENILNSIYSNLQYYRLQGEEYTLTQWANKLNLSFLNWLNNNNIYNEKIIQLNNLFGLEKHFCSFYRPEYIIRQFTNDYNNSKRQNLVLRMFQWLKNSNEIDFVVNYYSQCGNIKQNISREIYNSYFKELSEQVILHGYNYNEYKRHLTVFIRKRNSGELLDTFYKEFSNDVYSIEQHMIKTLGFTYAFQTVKITKVRYQDANVEPVNFEKIWGYYCDYIIPNTKRYRHKTKSNQEVIWAESHMFHRAFYYLAVTELCGSVDIEELESFEEDLRLFIQRNYLEYHVPFKIVDTEELLKNMAITDTIESITETILQQRSNFMIFKGDLKEHYERQNVQDLLKQFDLIDTWAE